MQPRSAITLGNFFSCTHFFLIIYIVSPYLATLMPAAATGLVIAAGAVVTLVLFPFAPKLIQRTGARKGAAALAFIEAVILLLLAGNPTPALAMVLVALACAISPLIAYQIDILLEATVAEESMTGQVRTKFLTYANIALILAPLLIGLLLDGTNAYYLVFLAASLSLVPFIALFALTPLPEGDPPRLRHIWSTLVCIWYDRNERHTLIGNYLLQFFYHSGPIYISLYLHGVIGLPWSTLGWMFAVALLPFVFIEFPAGWIADKWLGDKEIMIAGFLIMGVAYALLAVVTMATPVLLILAILVATRVGAALTEATVEGHFFRCVSERDVNSVGIFRMCRPVAALTAPVIGSALLFYGSYSILFITCGLGIALVGAYVASQIRDFR